MSRPHADWVQAAWEFIRASGRQGKRNGEVLAFIGNQASAGAVERSLRRMRMFGYLRMEGGTLHKGRWVVGPRTPLFAAQQRALAKAAQSKLPPAHADLIPLGRVNSVFALAQAVAPRDLREMAEATSQPMPLDAVAPAWLGRSA